MEYRKHFTFPEGTIYFNCAAQGPLSNVAARAAEQAIKDKQFPVLLDQNYGEAKTAAARKALSLLIDFPEKNIALADSTSWGINTLVQGLPLKAGDEVLMCAGQFPSNVAPWEILKSKGVVIKKIPLTDYIFDFDAFEKAITPQTKVASLEWVHFVSGDRIPLRQISDLCSKKGVFVIVDITQGLGGIPFSMKELGPDAVVCSSYKWLLSPYGSGFMALNDKIISALDPKIINWLCFEDIAWNGNLADCNYKLCDTAKKFDVFAHMGYLNISAMTESVNLLNELSPAKIYAYTRQLINNLDLNREYFEPINKGEEDRQSLIATFKIKKIDGEKLVQELKSQGIVASLRQGYLRLAPFLYNDLDEIKKCKKVLNQLVSSSGISTISPSNAVV